MCFSMSRFLLERHPGGPILVASPELSWEREGVFNPGVAWVNDEVVMLYRAVGERESYTSYFGLATSRDGITFTRQSAVPVFGPSLPYDQWATEDPRITLLNGQIYVTYVAVPDRIMDHGQGIKRDLPLETSGALLTTADFRNFTHLGVISPPGSDNKDIVLFPEKIGGRYLMLHRPNRWSKEWLATPFAKKTQTPLPCTPDELPAHPGIWLAQSEDLKTWTRHQLVLWPSHQEDAKIGPGLPPIKTSAGWLIIYHHVEIRAGKFIYSARAALLDLEDPEKLVAKLPYDILSPDLPFEQTPGAHIVFPTGGFVKQGKLYVYYGAGDGSIALATGSLSELLSAFNEFDM